MDSIPFTEPVLFLEFFVREVTYYGSDQSAKFPAGTLFYQGESQARSGQLPSFREATFREEPKPILPREKSFGFVNGQPSLLASQKRPFLDWIEKNPLDALLCIGREAWMEDQWVREKDREAFSVLHPGISRFTDIVNQAPFRFNVWVQDEVGTLLTDFPNAEVRQTLEVGNTYLFLCRQEEYLDQGYLVNPHRNLALFVKNHGLQREIRLVSKAEFAAHDVANLCTEPCKLRDHRKSRFKYLLG
ncbi:hypothetical protein [Haliscomenobacter sp.]|uniref:hypothetical protein n=1 Tax=Haliscomenobacter sp. TaxID=2717303 RepID=UPI0035948DCA